MFVKKLVEKAAAASSSSFSSPSSSKKYGGNSEGIKPEEVVPRLLFHCGIPYGAAKIAFEPFQKIVATSTRDGRIKLFGKDNTQAVLESPEAAQSKFLQFIQNKGILVNVTVNNRIEVWDIDEKILSSVHVFNGNITAFSTMHCNPFMYVGDSAGNVSVLKFDQEIRLMEEMKYIIPLSVSHGNTNEVSADTAVVQILPQPTAESKRVLIIFSDGLIALWEIRESRAIFTTGLNLMQTQHHEPKKLTSACWVCPFGSMVAVGYSNGEIFIWSICVPSAQNARVELTSEAAAQSAPISKLNLGYKTDKVPIASLKWLHADGKASRLYVMGASDVPSSTNLVQVILLNEQLETRTVKLGLHLSQPCIDMEIISSSAELNKQKQDAFVLIGLSGHIHVYDDCLIEKYLLQSQSRGSPSMPKEVIMKMPFADSSITAAKFVTDNPSILGLGDEDYSTLARNMPSLFPLDGKLKDGSHMNLGHFSGFTKIKNFYISGHADGAINIWDVSCPAFFPVLSLKQQSEDNLSLSGVAVTALYFDASSRLLVSGDQNGTVRVYKFKPEPYSENSFMSFQGSSKKGNNHMIQSLKLIKVNGSILTINIARNSGHLAVGTDQGYVSVIDKDGPSLLYEKHIATEMSSGIISLHFETCNVLGFDKNILAVATKDSSVLALDSATGDMLSTSTVHPKKQSQALFLQILEPNIGTAVQDSLRQQSLLICSEKAAYVYSLVHAVQGIKKVLYKKKFHSCCWASTFYSGSSIALVLVFTTGKIEIRSLPLLSLIKESSIRGFTYSGPKLNALSDSSICCSQDGELVMTNGDQDMSVVSILAQKKNFRLLDSLNEVYRKDVIISQEGLASMPSNQKEKKKGIFGSLMKRSKAKDVPEFEIEDTKESIEELSMIFSSANFEREAENKDGMTLNDDELELDIDDIDLDDSEGKAKDHNKMLASFNKELAGKFQAFKGKVKHMTVKNEKSNKKVEEQQQQEQTVAVDQIKKKYGFSSYTEPSAAKMAENKLHENARKLQDINLKTTEMQDTAQSFASMAKEVQRIAEKK